MKQRQLFPAGVPARFGVVLGAGASRGVSYAEECDIQSPLDADFFDLLQRVEAGSSDEHAVQSVVKQAQKLPYDCWRSMERAFYTIHLRAYLDAKLTGDEYDDRPDERVIKEFAQAVQVLLRKAHAKRSCAHHKRLIESLREPDTILSFNYDLVPERAMKPVAEARKISFERWIYGFIANKNSADLPLILKLHGSSNWKLTKSDKTDIIDVLTQSWDQLDETPGYRGHLGEGSSFPIFLPFWDKRVERKPWLQIWRKAFERLGEVEALIVWGYSLPQTDIKAQHFFSLALDGKAVKLCVIDPSAETRKRWLELLPKAHFFPYDSIEKFFRAAPAWWRRRERAEEAE
jgi:hypothetical protein